MKKKTSNKKKKPTIVFNPVLDDVSEPLSFTKKTKKTKFLNISVEFGLRAVIINWVVQGVGIGQVIYYIDAKNKLHRDDENMGDAFCLELIAEIEKKQTKLPLTKKVIKNQGLTVNTEYLFNYLKKLNESAIKK